MELKCSFLLNCRHHRCNILTSPTAVAIWIWDVAGCKQSGSAMMLMPGSEPQINVHVWGESHLHDNVVLHDWLEPQCSFFGFLLWFGLHSRTIEVEPCQWTSNKSQKTSGFWCTTSNYWDDRPPQDWQSWSIARLGFSCCQAVGCRLKQSKKSNWTNGLSSNTWSKQKSGLLSLHKVIVRI